jgi:hypothetical protein
MQKTYIRFSKYIKKCIYVYMPNITNWNVYWTIAFKFYLFSLYFAGSIISRSDLSIQPKTVRWTLLEEVLQSSEMEPIFDYVDTVKIIEALSISTQFQGIVPQGINHIFLKINLYCINVWLKTYNVNWK